MSRVRRKSTDAAATKCQTLEGPGHEINRKTKNDPGLSKAWPLRIGCLKHLHTQKLSGGPEDGDSESHVCIEHKSLPLQPAESREEQGSCTAKI